jgi:hypothetical protein
MSKKNTAEVSYYRHTAFGGKFSRLNGTWYLKITPTYRFTLDGENEHPFSDRLLKGIKGLERNEAILGQLLMWEDYLTSSSLFMERYNLLSFGRLLRYKINVGINDQFWLSNDDEAETEIAPVLKEEDFLF